MSSYFKLNSNPDFLNEIMFASLINGVDSSSKLAPIPEPTIGNGIINVSKSFKWTKTQRRQDNDFLQDNIPVLHLREYYVTQPGFVTNVQNIFATAMSSISNLGSFAVNALGDINSPVAEGSILDTAGDFFSGLLHTAENATGFDTTQAIQDADPRNKSLIKDVSGAVSGVLSNFLKSQNIVSRGISVEGYPYMKTYENMYGVTASKFKYIIPFFEDNWKSINNSWQDINASEGLGSLFGGKAFSGATKGMEIAKQLSTGFGVDFAKTFSYASEGPSTKLSLVLDNTYDSYFDNRRYNSYQHNWELIFLLLYQNLPNRRNKLFFDPPVIYKAQVPGVFSYLYSYISALSVECVGNRQPREIFLNFQNEEGLLELKTFKTLIPEAFKVNIEIKSLLPETKNLFLHSFEDKITTSTQNPISIQNPNNTSETVRNRGSLFPQGL